MTTQIVQKAVILNEEGEMLMLRRSQTNNRRPLQWDLPGGLHEPGEELIISVKREITEETGLDVNNIEPVYAKTEIRQWRDDSRHTQNVVFIFYMTKSDKRDIKLSYEHDKFQWRPIKKAVEDFEYYLHKELLKHIIDNKLTLAN